LELLEFRRLDYLAPHRPSAKLKQTPMTTTPGMIHTVYFWLKPGLNEADRADFVRGAKQLAEAPTVLNCFVGAPADTPEREVTDHSFDYSLHLLFTDVQTHNAYQVDPVHLKFVEEQAHKFASVKVLDTSL
jgi:hypothetical protein